MLRIKNGGTERGGADKDDNESKFYISSDRFGDVDGLRLNHSSIILIVQSELSAAPTTRRPTAKFSSIDETIADVIASPGQTSGMPGG